MCVFPQWTFAERETIRQLYPVGGIKLTEVALPGRTRGAIYKQACKMQVESGMPWGGRVPGRGSWRKPIQDTSQLNNWRGPATPGALRAAI